MNGSLSQKIAQQGYEVVGVEDSTSGILFARQNFAQCHFIQASIYDLPYAELEDAFDIVVSVEVIEHLLYPIELISVAKKCLKPEEKLIITTPHHSYFKNLILALVGQIDSHFTALWDGGYIKFFSVSTLYQRLKEEGLEQIQFKFGGGLPYLWKSMLCSSSLTKELS
jgi:2-polyprenyl-3-methyl-5-hydroxy-6-metoxy-1,4-benzoquinol methylase